MISAPQKPQQKSGIDDKASSKLMVFFVVAYLAQGLSCAQFGVISQPLQYFLMKELRLSAADISSYLALMMIPWVIKPMWGLISDFVPLFGYTRKSYLVLANVLTALSFAVMLCSPSLPTILVALFCTASAMSVATALMVALVVEQGRKDGRAREYFCVQEVCYYGANMIAAISGGLLCQKFAPQVAFHWAVAICIAPPVLVGIVGGLLLQEKKSRLDTAKLRQTVTSLAHAVRSRSLLVIGLFSFAWNFNLFQGVPLYFFESNSLHFAQASIGQLSAWNSAGMLVAAVLYTRLTKGFSLKQQLLLSALVCSLSTLSYLCLTNYTAAILLEFLRGMAGMVAILSVYIVAADVCPSRVEASVMALLVAIRNMATNASIFVGGQLFTHVFHNDFTPLVLTACAAPMLSLLLTLLLPAEKKSDAA